MPIETSLLISASPLKTQSHLTALRFVEELINQKVTVRSIFFYQDAVLVANQFNLPPSDEPLIREFWKKLSAQHGIELQTCIAASLRRGIIDNQQANEQKIENGNLDPAFIITGLGQLAAAMSNKKIKLIHFK